MPESDTTNGRGYHQTHADYMLNVDPAVLDPDSFPETHRVLGDKLPSRQPEPKVYTKTKTGGKTT